MSSPTGAILNGLDPQLQAIQEKLRRGVPLTKAESARWANRLAVEKETLRTGGSVKESAVPQTPAAPRMTPEQAGARDETQAQGYMRGREMAKNPPQARTDGTFPGQPPMRQSQVMGDAPAAVKNFDNGLGPHRGQDGLPATWNVPKQVAGRYNGGNLDEGANLPAGTIAMQGADGQFKQWKGGAFGPERYGSLQEVGQPPKPAPEVKPTPEMDAVARGAMPRSNKMAPMPLPGEMTPAEGGPVAPIADMQPKPADPTALAQAWAGQGGMLPRATPQAAPMIAPQAMPVAKRAAPMPEPALSEAVAQQPDQKDSPWGPGQVVTPGPGRGSQAAAPMFPNAIWNSGVVPQAPAPSIPRPRPYQDAAAAMNPFEDPTKRRRMAVMPE